MSVRLSILGMAMSTLLGLCAPAAAEEKTVDARNLEFFEAKIRPVLVRHCYECHSAGTTKIKGNLLLDTRDGLVKGGDSGTALVPGRPDGSLLIQALRYDGLEMPPSGKLPEHVVADFVRWVELGAPDPRTKATPSTDVATTSDGAPAEPSPDLWSLRTISAPTIPQVGHSSWPWTDVDHFILARLEAQGLRPNPDAEPITLLRRLHYVLTGLPPTQEEASRFLSLITGDRRSAIEHTVSELLSSQQFGHRWARHWLDLARYADVSGSTAPAVFPEAWRYRQYVIHAFNTDKPFDRFVREQLAGDLLPAATPEEKTEALIATGYLALFHIVSADRDPEKRALDAVDEQLDTLGRNFLGISLGCARCHDHKLDPVPTRDYYALAGILRSTANFSGGFGTSAPAGVPLAAVPESAPAWMQGDGVRVLAAFEPEPPRDVAIRIRGEVELLGEVVPRGVPSLAQLSHPSRIPADQSGRLELAEWLLAPENPLVARVIVNRVWHHLFGQGLVRTTDNFGTTGAPPSHPELLDYLADRFRRHHGWSLKSLIAELLASRTWQQTATLNSAAIEVDPDNRLLGRANRRRLDAETLHDAMFFVSGQLDLEPATLTSPSFAGGNQASTVGLAIPAEILRKRAIYWPVFRKDIPVSLDMLTLFDMPPATSARGTRAVSVVPAQGLFLLNSPLVLECAAALAVQLDAKAGSTTDEARVDQLYRCLFCRDPRREERARALRFVAEYEQMLSQTHPPLKDAQQTAWTRLCHTLLISTEFLFIE